MGQFETPSVHDRFPAARGTSWAATLGLAGMTAYRPMVTRPSAMARMCRCWPRVSCADYDACRALVRHKLARLVQVIPGHGASAVDPATAFKPGGDLQTTTRAVDVAERYLPGRRDDVSAGLALELLTISGEGDVLRGQIPCCRAWPVRIFESEVRLGYLARHARHRGFQVITQVPQAFRRLTDVRTAMLYKPSKNALYRVSRVTGVIAHDWVGRNLDEGAVEHGHQTPDIGVETGRAQLERPAVGKSFQQIWQVSGGRHPAPSSSTGMTRIPRVRAVAISSRTRSEGSSSRRRPVSPRYR